MEFMLEQVQYIEYYLENDFKNSRELAKEFDCSTEEIVNARYYIGKQLRDVARASRKLNAVDNSVVWTPEEDNIIISYLEKHGDLDMEIMKTFINKNATQIKRREQQLRTANKVRKVEEIIWNDKKLEYFIENYPTTMNTKISEVLNISTHRIEKKAAELGLEKADLIQIKKEEILKHWKDGVTAKETAKKVGVPISKIYDFSSKNKIRFKSVVPGLKDKNNAISKEARLGVPFEEIMKKYNVAEITVRRLSYIRWDEDEWREEHML